jgi:5-methylcytosine-specific restriction endonuclease McrA
MELHYSFDSEKWHLGTPCRNGHRWPGSGLSIRRNYKGAAACAGCKTNVEAELPWLFRFIDLDASGVPAGYKLGKLCPSEHSWNDTGYTLRKHGHCVECEKLRPRHGYDRARQKHYYEQNAELLRQKASESQRKRRLLDPEGENAKAAAYKRQARADGRMPPRSKHGLPYTPVGDVETQAMRKAIRQSGRLPSVARLVYEQQREHWRQHPADYETYNSERSKHNFRWRYMVDPKFRLYHRSKARERKARERGSTTLMLSPDQLWRRWVQFNHCCAYCGTNGDLHMEHVIPISKGGEHHLGNIVPACQRCNYSKHTSEAQAWYRSQPFFDETRWHHIQSLLAQSQPSFQQLVFL